MCILAFLSIFITINFSTQPPNQSICTENTRNFFFKINQTNHKQESINLLIKIETIQNRHKFQFNRQRGSLNFNSIDKKIEVGSICKVKKKEIEKWKDLPEKQRNFQLKHRRWSKEEEDEEEEGEDDEEEEELVEKEGRGE